MKKIVCAALFAVLCTVAFGQKLNVASYNVRYANQYDSLGGNGWGTRVPVICSMIQFYDFDIIGAQEVHYHQTQDLLAGLPGYACVGEGRDGGRKGEHSAIFYKTSRFDLLKSGTFWLSPTDETHPNVGWDAALTRVCTWVQLRDKPTGKVFWHFNTHFDHVGLEARRESAKLILKKIKEMAGRDMVMLTGDFNVNQFDESYTLLATSDIMKDCYPNAEIRMAWNGTFNDFNPKANNARRIDHVFVSKPARVMRYGILTQMYWTPVREDMPENVTDKPGSEIRAPSDHYPVAVQIEF